MVWNDTADFLGQLPGAVAQHRAVDRQRSPLTPVVLKVLGGDLGHYVTVQAVVAAVLGGAGRLRGVGRRPRLAPRWPSWPSWPSRFTDPVVMWDQSALSESLAVSVLALAVAAGVQVAARRRPPSPAWWRCWPCGWACGTARRWCGAGGLALGALAAHRLWVRRRPRTVPGRRWPPR